MLLRLAGGGTHGLRELYAQQEDTSLEAEKILSQLEDAGLVAGDPARGFSLTLPPRKITIARVVDAVSPDLYTLAAERGDKVVEVLQPLFERLRGERRALQPDLALVEGAKKRLALSCSSVIVNYITITEWISNGTTANRYTARFGTASSL
jgi:hypothetical protein